MDDIKYYEALSEGMKSENFSMDFTKPTIKPTLLNVYILFILLYAVTVVCGVCLNIFLIFHVISERLYRDATCGYFVNIALADIIKCLFVLPITLMVTLVQNWTWGSFLCYFLPMLQDIPLHSTMLSFVMIAFDRYKFLKRPLNPRLPVFVFATGTWLSSLCIVLPYPIYTTYIDLGTHHPILKGLGLCVGNLTDDMREYLRFTFFLTYVTPLIGIIYLYVKMSKILTDQDGPLPVVVYEARTRTDSGVSSTCYADYSLRGPCRESSQFRLRTSNGNHFDMYEAELDIKKELRTQKYMTSIVTIFAICLGPLMIISRLAKLTMVETYENSVRIDFAFITLIWLAFFPTISTPILFLSWRMNRSTKERLKGYFRLSTRRKLLGTAAYRPEEEEVLNTSTCPVENNVKQFQPISEQLHYSPSKRSQSKNSRGSSGINLS
uniref:Orexin receptor type 2 n=1 Tax=Cacopsylla melanoneura TaxID=428564 RepID=A0A8D9BI56_9HEMI